MVTNIKFGECMRSLLSILDISVNRLSNTINVDRSLVNRWINEKRTPSYNTIYIESISEYLSNNILNSFQEQHLNELFMKVCGNNDMDISIKEKIKKVLFQSQGYSIECRKKALKESKVHSIGKKEIPNFLNAHVDNPSYSVNLSSEDKIIIGCKNILSSGISLLKEASTHAGSTNNTIYISFNSDACTTCYLDCNLTYWRDALLEAMNNGWNVLFLLKLNNNINRTVRFINFSQPLISTGKFRPYYFQKYDYFATDKDYIIVPEVGALICLSGNQHSGADTAFFFKNKVAIEVFKNNFSSILSDFAHPLFRYYSREDAIEYSHCLAEYEDSIGSRIMFKYDFSIMTLPKNLYVKLLKRKKLSNDEILLSVKFYNRRIKAFLSNINNYKYNDIYFLNCINNLIKYRKLNLYCYNGVEVIDLTAKDIIELLKNIISLLEKYSNYNIGFISESPSNPIWNPNSYCMVKERKAVILESYKATKNLPEIRLSIEEPIFVKAFDLYFKEIWDQIAPINKDKKEIISWMQCLINLLKEHN